jgi:hypothetical protein
MSKSRQLKASANALVADRFPMSRDEIIDFLRDQH